MPMPDFFLTFSLFAPENLLQPWLDQWGNGQAFEGYSSSVSSMKLKEASVE